MISLSDLRAGMSGEVAGLVHENRHHVGSCSGRHHRYGAQRLCEMGFYEGQRITVVHNSAEGPLVIRLRDSRMVLGRGIARTILIKV